MMQSNSTMNASEVMPKAPKSEEKSQVKVGPASAKTAPAQPAAAQNSAKTAPVQPAAAQNSPLPPVSVQPVLVPHVTAQPAPAQPTQAPPTMATPPVAPQSIVSPPTIEGLSKGEEKDASEKEVEVKKSKKSKKNKNKKNQQSAEAKGAAPQQAQQQPTEAKKASTPVDGKEPPRKVEAKKESPQPKVEPKKEQQPQQQKVETKKEQQQQKAEAKKEQQQQQQAPPHEGKKGKNKDKEAKKGNQGSSAGKGSLVDEIARARQHITNSLHCDGATLAGGDAADILARLAKLEVENKQLSKVKDDVKNLTSLLSKLTQRLEILEKNQKGSGEPAPAAPAARPKAAAQKKQPPPKEEDDDINLFGSDDEDDAEKERVKAERLKMYEEKKSKKPTLIAKSNIILDVKPWDDETDMKAMEAKVREVACDGLLWGASKLVPLAYGIHKLQISCVIEDEKVSVDWLQETIEANEDLVQSVDIAAFNKV